MRRNNRLLALALAAFSLACGEKPRDITVGVHQLTVAVPDGWEYLDHGLEHLFQCEYAQLAIKDLGAATTPGYVAEVEAARELWRQGRLEAARARIRGIQTPRRSGSTNEEHKEFRKLWYRLRSDRVPEDAASMEEAYAQVLEALKPFTDVQFDDLVDDSLNQLGHDQRRDIASRKRITIDEREVVLVDTWDRLSHDHRQRYAFLINQGHMLVVWTKRGKFSDAERGFEDLLQSLNVRVPVAVPASDQAGL